MALSGYVYEVEQAARFSRDWDKCLDALGLPFAHMTDCAHGNGPYKELSKADRIQSEVLLIQNIKRRTKVGISIIVEPDLYNDVVATRSPRMPSAYSFCIMAFVSAVGRWAEKVGYGGKFSYFFEAGHRFQSQANAYMNDLPRSKSAEQYRYLSHKFYSKHEASPLQAADMLAWQSCHYFERSLDGHLEARKDFKALVRPWDYMNFYKKDELERMVPVLKAAAEMSAAPENPFAAQANSVRTR